VIPWQRKKQMREENPAVAGGSSASAVQSAGTLAGVHKVRLLAGRFRWVICGLLFLGITKNYMDRQVLGVLKGPLQHDLGWNDIDYGHLVFAFQAAYAVGMLSMGRLIDRFGTRTGYGVAIVFWSLASMGHALANSLTGFVIARSALGFGEAGVFPASLKCIAEWFPRKERALATGIFNAGTSVGAIVTPLLVPWIAARLGWRWAFLFTGALGFAWLILWLLLYQKPREHSSCTDSEREYIQSDPGSLPVRPNGRSFFLTNRLGRTQPENS
jgi:ACS family hexuronate transporter-like MFS transporter